ncbi:MAG: hypothetical protein E7316_08475 [Clostridiales bacterium]|nr:hypothetical protein [Clostridiales bacterium]
MEWLHPFIALTLSCGVVLSLLPEGSLRRTAALVLGLVLTLCWAEGLAGLIQWPSLPQPPQTALTLTGFDADRAQAEYAATLAGGGE